ncbi:hypothetical protein Tco_1450687, partial [Tanacetum coccineum]
GPIPRMTPTQALTAIQTMADHSQKWHDGTSRRNVSSNSNTDGLAASISKLDNLGLNMKEAERKCSCDPNWMSNLRRTSP